MINRLMITMKVMGKSLWNQTSPRLSNPSDSYSTPHPTPCRLNRSFCSQRLWTAAWLSTLAIGSCGQLERTYAHGDHASACAHKGSCAKDRPASTNQSSCESSCGSSCDKQSREKNARVHDSSSSQANPAVQASSPAQDFALLAFVDINRTSWTVASWQSTRRKPVLLVFWAPWCGPCMEEMPSLARFAQKHAGLLDVLPISIDDLATRPSVLTPRIDTKDHVRSELALFQKAPENPHWDSIFHSHNIRQIPSFVLLSAQGKVLKKLCGKQDWESPSVIQSFVELLPPDTPLNQTVTSQPKPASAPSLKKPGGGDHHRSHRNRKKSPCKRRNKGVTVVKQAKQRSKTYPKKAQRPVQKKNKPSLRSA